MSDVPAAAQAAALTIVEAIENLTQMADTLATGLGAIAVAIADGREVTEQQLLDAREILIAWASMRSICEQTTAGTRASFDLPTERSKL